MHQTLGFRGTGKSIGLKGSRLAINRGAACLLPGRPNPQFMNSGGKFPKGPGIKMFTTITFSGAYLAVVG